VLIRHNIETVGLPTWKVVSFFWPIKDDLGMKTAGIHSIPCKYGTVYIGRPRCSIEMRIKQHHQHIRLYHPDKSAMAKHSINLGHCIQFQDTRILTTRIGCMQCTIRETRKIELPPDNMNKEDDFSWSKSQKPLLQTLRRRVTYVCF